MAEREGANSVTPVDKLTKQDFYIENVKRITEHRAQAVRDRPDLAGWLYELTGRTIPYRVFDDPTCHGNRTQDASLADVDGIYFNQCHGTCVPCCDLCGEEKLVRLLIFVPAPSSEHRARATEPRYVYEILRFISPVNRLSHFFPMLGSMGTSIRNAGTRTASYRLSSSATRRNSRHIWRLASSNPMQNKLKVKEPKE